MTKNTPPKKYKVHTLERGLDLIELLAERASEKSLSEISQEAGFNTATTHRILDALKSRGYIMQNPINSKYRLSTKVFEIGSAVQRSISCRDEALPILSDLAAKTGETAYLIIREGDEALCVERVEGHNYIQILFLQVGTRIPLYIGAGPRVLFAHMLEEEVDRIIARQTLSAWTSRTITDPIKLKDDLKKIREHGYALSMEDVTDGAAALGCPVRNHDNSVMAAISISGIAANFKGKKISPIIEVVKAAAADLSRRLHAPE